MSAQESMCECDYRKYLEARFTALEKSKEIAYISMEKRLDNMNEFRQQLKDQNNMSFTRAEHEMFRDKIDSQIKFLELSKASLDGKASQNQLTVTFLIAVTGVLLSILDIAIRIIEHSK